MIIRGAMTLNQEMDVAAMRRKLEELKTEHRDLDDAISALAGSSSQNHLQLQRMKKRKLVLKDQISQLENLLLPDIIA
jgi:hypothetical protein